MKWLLLNPCSQSCRIATNVIFLVDTCLFFFFFHLFISFYFFEYTLGTDPIVHQILFTCPWRKTIVCFETAGIGFENDGVNEEQVAVVIYKHITIYGIEDIV